MTVVNFEPLWKWARIRELARVRKEEEGRPHPWVNSKIISNYRFCNVRREDDFVTIWIRDNIRSAFKRSENLWLMLCIARVINWPDSLEEIIAGGLDGHCPEAWPEDDWSREDFKTVLHNRQRRGGKVFTGAYTITAPPEKGASKIDFVARSTIGKLWKARDQFYEHFADRENLTLCGTHKLLMSFPGWGPFMAYQAVVDMRFTNLLHGAPDIADWAAAGPGTRRGLNRVHGRDINYVLSPRQALREMREIFRLAKEELPNIDIDFSDVPNMLCETDKYLRVLNKEGTPRARYVPGRGF